MFVLLHSKLSEEAKKTGTLIGLHYNRREEKAAIGMRLVTVAWEASTKTVVKAVAELIEHEMLVLLKKGAGTAPSEYALSVPDYLEDPLWRTVAHARELYWAIGRNASVSRDDAIAAVKRLSVSLTETLSAPHGSETGDSVSPDGNAEGGGVAFPCEPVAFSATPASVFQGEPSVSPEGNRTPRTQVLTPLTRDGSGDATLGGITGPISRLSEAPAPEGASKEEWESCKEMLEPVWYALTDDERDRLLAEWPTFRAAGAFVRKSTEILDHGYGDFLTAALTAREVATEGSYTGANSIVAAMMRRTTRIHGEVMQLAARADQPEVPEQNATADVLANLTQHFTKGDPW